MSGAARTFFRIVSVTLAAIATFIYLPIIFGIIPLVFESTVEVYRLNVNPDVLGALSILLSPVALLGMWYSVLIKSEHWCKWPRTTICFAVVSLPSYLYCIFFLRDFSSIELVFRLPYVGILLLVTYGLIILGAYQYTVFFRKFVQPERLFGKVRAIK